MEDIYPVIFIDLLLLTYLTYKMIRVIIDYNKWISYTCTEPLGIFVIVQCSNIIIFRLFYYLERHYQYSRILARLTQELEQEQSARTMVIIMRRFKYASSFGFLVLTGLATIWFLQDNRTCHVVLSSDLRNWLILSWGVCLLYFVMLIWSRKFALSLEYDIEMVPRLNSGALRLVFGGQEEAHVGLSEREIQSLEKCQLSRIEELKMIVTWTEDCEASDEFQPECSICIDKIKVNEFYKQLPECEHYFHADCIDGWLRVRGSCPLCRQTVQIPELELISGPSDVEVAVEE